jgi:starch phosphorylase
MAKRIIRLANDVAKVVNGDPQVHDQLRVLFLPNYCVSLAELVIPAADLSEQVSTAGTEASGTGNMKFSLNGALTIGTLDGANVEIREAVGAENFFLFGMTDAEVEAKRRAGYHPRAYYEQDHALASAMDAIASGVYSDGDTGRHRPVVDNLLSRDPFLLLADYSSYAAAQKEVEAAFLDVDRWSRMVWKNVAGMGRFSSDNTIGGYARDIWKVPLSRKR